MSSKIFADLNEEQAEAVKFVDHPLIILAGAGSGKTRVITNKIANLIEEHGYSPLNILGVTFTNKAANEMKNRVTGITGVDPFLFNISTFHSLGLRILRESGDKSGFGSDWSVSDDKDQKKAAQIKPFTDYLNEMIASLESTTSFEKREAMEEFYWMIEEFKVSLFAQELKTPYPVSIKKLNQQVRRIQRMI